MDVSKCVNETASPVGRQIPASSVNQVPRQPATNSSSVLGQPSAMLSSVRAIWRATFTSSSNVP